MIGPCKVKNLAAALGFLFASPALATPGQVCALLTPFFEQPPGHFTDQLGVKTSNNAWESKPNPQAQALNAKCNITAYVANRLDFSCETNFDVEQVDQQTAFFHDAVNGVDYCMANLVFGNSARRATNHSDDENSQSDQVNWYKTESKNYATGNQFGATVDSTFYKSTKSRRVKIELFYDTKK